MFLRLGLAVSRHICQLERNQRNMTLTWRKSILTRSALARWRRASARVLSVLAITATMMLPTRLPAKQGILPSSKLRLIVLTDINSYGAEADDAESLIRLMLYSNQIDIEAIISTPSWCCQTVDEASYQRILTAVNAYGQVRTNLAVHAGGYPSLQYLSTA